MNFRYMIARAEKFVTDNSPMILTGIGVTGTITTAVLASKATLRAAEILNDPNDVGPETTDREKFELLWKLYIPTVLTGAGTCAAIVFANRIGTRRAAAMAAAYSISERAFDEYRDKIVEKVGEKKERAARDEIAQERVNAQPLSQSTVFVANGANTICKDARSGRYFSSDMETIKKAQNDTNHEIINHGYSSLTDFYSRIGLEPTKESDEVGWNSDKLLEIYFSTTISDDQKPVLVMDFRVDPVRNYFRSH